MAGARFLRPADRKEAAYAEIEVVVRRLVKCEGSLKNLERNPPTDWSRRRATHEAALEGRLMHKSR
jgi:hypothetical protein